MRAATVTSFGGPEVFEIVRRPDPSPGPGEVAIDVEAADVLWLETLIRSGAGQNYWPHRPPYVPGNGVAGRVRQVGPGADPALVGRLVVAHTGNQGGYADQVVVAPGEVSPVPGGVGADVAAAVLHDAVTALALFDVTKVGAGDTVLVAGASGGLGIMSVQLGRARGARVVALARGAKLARVRDLGPDAAVDSGSPDWLSQARAALPNGADVVLDNVGGDLGEASFGLVADGGRFSAHGTPSGRFAQVDPAEATRKGVTVTGIQAVQLAKAGLKAYTEQALADAAAGVIAPVIGQVFPLEQAGQAHAAIEARTVFGKTLLTTA